MTKPDFDEIIDRRGTHCAKLDGMEAIYGVSPERGGLAMWVADMDFRPPEVVNQALERIVAGGVLGYPTAPYPEYLAAIRWWMKTRHGWAIEDDWILNTTGVVNAVAIAIQAFSRPGNGVAVMSPVYHEFAKVIGAADRRLVELPLAFTDGIYGMDFNGWETRLTGDERILILCSPHNPGGRVWSPEELRQVADFCIRHDLILLSDDVHCDLVMPGGPRHHMIADLCPDIADRVITVTAPSKTFNIAGVRLAQVIVADPDLKSSYRKALSASGVATVIFGMPMTAAAYSPEGAEWVDALVAYLDGNRRLFDEGIAAIPGLRSMPLQATYLSWVDFAGTGMDRAEFTRRVQTDACIAANHGVTFGSGGETFMRFNIATPRSRVIQAVDRLQRAFADLQ